MPLRNHEWLRDVVSYFKSILHFSGVPLLASFFHIHLSVVEEKIGLAARVPIKWQSSFVVTLYQNLFSNSWFSVIRYPPLSELGNLFEGRPFNAATLAKPVFQSFFQRGDTCER